MGQVFLHARTYIHTKTITYYIISHATGPSMEDTQLCKWASRSMLRCSTAN